jgi:hypothetical protein
MKRFEVFLKSLVFWGVVCLLFTLFGSRSLVPWMAGVGLVLSLAAWIFANWVGVEYTQDDILMVLGTLYWKSGIEIGDEMAAAKGVGKSFVDLMFREPGTGWLYVNLNDLIESGLIESRKAIDPDRVYKHNGKPFMEFRLTGDGQRRKDDRIDEIQEEKRKGVSGIPAPNP